MQNQRGFIGVGVLIAILVGLAVLGGGAYYFVQQQSPNVSVSPTSGTVPLAVTFSAPGGMYALHFDYGDGDFNDTAIENGRVHTYTKTGTYTATVQRFTRCSSWECTGPMETLRTFTITVTETNSDNPTTGVTNTAAQTTKTQNTQTQKATATIDKSSLTTSSATPVVSGTASGIARIIVVINTGSAAQNYPAPLGRWVNVSNGKWSVKFEGPGAFLEGGTYTVAVYDAGTEKLLTSAPLVSTTGRFDASLTSGSAPLQVQFAFYKAKAGAQIDFGDHSVPEVLYESNTTSYANHTYTSAGTYTATYREGSEVIGSETIVVKSTAAVSTISNTLFSHPNDGYAFTYDSSKLEARTTSATEFPSGTGLLPSSAVFSGGGYGQEAEILTYRGSIDAAQEAFIGAYQQYYSPQVLGTENVTINGNQARVVRYKVGPTYPEAKVYLIAYRPNEPRTIVATGDYSVIATIKNQ